MSTHLMAVLRAELYYLVLAATTLLVSAGSPCSATAADAADAVEATPDPKIFGSPGDGLTLDLGPTFSLNVRSRIQLRWEATLPPEGAAEDLLQNVSIGTARLWFSGRVYRPEFTYMIQLAVAGRDFRDSATSPIFDAYVDWKAHRDFSIRAGQFFVPFDRLRTVREWGLQMADRPRPVAELTLDRDVGIMMYSNTFLGDSSPFAWRLGVFGGGGTNLSTSKEAGALLVARLELRPLGPIDDDTEGDISRRNRPGLALGAAFAANLNTNRVRSTTGGAFTGGTTDFYHAAADLVFKGWGLAVQGEYLWKKAGESEIRSTDDAGESVVERTRSAHGWVAQTSYAFDPPLELVARLSRMYALTPTDPAFESELDTKGQEVAAGANYYFNGHRLKLQADWIARLPGSFDFDRAGHSFHVQLDATF